MCHIHVMYVSQRDKVIDRQNFGKCEQLSQSTRNLTVQGK